MSAVVAGLCLSAGCLDMRESSAGTQPDGAPETAPVIGRLQMQDRTIDLTVSSFADAPGAGPGQGVVPTRSYARVMADCQVRDRAQTRDESARPHALSIDHDERSDLLNGLRNTGLRP
jgi:hypothetical protein